MKRVAQFAGSPGQGAITGPSPGAHKFTMQYFTIEAFPVVFECRVLTVQPL